MKRILPLLLVLFLLLSACGAPAETEAEPDPTLPPESEPGAAAEPAATPSVGLDENELPIMGPGQFVPADDTQATLPALSDDTVTLDGLSSYLRVTLPEGWTWEQAEGPAEVEMIVLRPEDDPDFAVELRLWNDGFPGLCGTGMTFSEYTLPDGRTATLAYEVVNEEIWWWLILPENPDSFTIQFGAPNASYEAHQAELELLLGSIRQGMLAGLDVVTEDEPTA